MSKIESLLAAIDKKINHIQTNILRIEEKLDHSISLTRNHLIRIKNQENIPDEMILLGSPYNDLDPQRAFKIYQDANVNFLILDVSSPFFPRRGELSESLQISLEELPARWQEIPSKTTPILVISEDGVRSILACEYLVQKGFFNLNNISGGYQHFPSTKANKDNPKLVSV